MHLAARETTAAGERTGAAAIGSNADADDVRIPEAVGYAAVIVPDQSADTTGAHTIAHVHVAGGIGIGDRAEVVPDQPADTIGSCTIAQVHPHVARGV